MTTDYINTALEQDFGSIAPIISTWLENRMLDLTDQWETFTSEEQAAFQETLELLIYPFLACYKALLDSDIPEDLAGKYCQRIWEKMTGKNVEEAVFH